MFFDIADILASQTEDNGTIVVQLGDADSETVYSTDNEVWGPAGLASRPSLPSDGQAAQALHISTGDRDHVLGIQDKRFSTIYGSLSDGETSLYATGPEGEGTGRVMLKDDGGTASITLLLQKDNDTQGLPITLQLKSNGTFSVAIADKGGFTFNEDGWSLISTNGVTSSAFSVTPTEINMVSPKININGQGVLLGPSASSATPVIVNVVSGAGQPSTSVVCSP